MSGKSLEPYIFDGDYIIIQKIIKTPQKGDFVVVKQEGKYIIYLVIGLPGDKIELKNGTFLINNEPLENTVYDFQFLSTNKVIIVPEGYFCGVGTKSNYEDPWKLIDLSDCLYKQSNIVGKLFPLNLILKLQNIQDQMPVMVIFQFLVLKIQNIIVLKKENLFVVVEKL